MAVLNLLSLCIFIPNFLYAVINSNNGGVEASHMVYPQFQSLSAVSVHQLHRTAYHFQPSKNWMNGFFYVSFLEI
ncbi:hypothetical protein PTKIN_Ptkin13bG0245400 [Pterospermum kingtungense]